MTTEDEIDYKYEEPKYLKELAEYVNKTYKQHYAQEDIEATQFIIDSGLAGGHCLGSIIKYCKRYGKKGTKEDHRLDLFKIAHYAIMMLHAHDLYESRGINTRK